MNKIIRKRVGGALAGVGVLGVLVALAMGLSSQPPVAVFAVPQSGHYFYGNATIGGASASEGTAITARIGGTTFGTAAGDNQGRDGDPEPYLKGPGDDPETPGEEGGAAGDHH